MDINTVKAQWQQLSTAIEEVDYPTCGYDYSICFECDKVRDFAALMFKEGFYLVGITAVHVDPAIEVVYQYACFDTRCRVMARTFVDDRGGLATISDIYPGANWHEREVRDFHGVVFIDHPNLEPLILPEDEADLKPLLKTEAKLKNITAVRRQPSPPESDPEVAVKSQEQS